MRIGRSFPLRNPHKGQPPAQGVYSEFNVSRADFITNLDSAQSEGTGWDAKVKAALQPKDVVRTSESVVTLTLPAVGDYDITAQETITGTAPASGLAGGVELAGSPTFTVDKSGGSITIFHHHYQSMRHA